MGICDIEVLIRAPKDVSFRFYGKGKMTTNSDGFEDQWQPAEALKFAQNGSVYANIGDFYDAGMYWAKWFKKGRWRGITEKNLNEPVIKYDNKKITV